MTREKPWKFSQFSHQFCKTNLFLNLILLVCTIYITGSTADIFVCLFVYTYRFRTVSSTSDSFTIKLTVERLGGTLGSVLVSYNTPGITHESISIGSYTASNAQIGSHYLYADGTLNFTEGLTLVSLDITILGNILSVGETRLLYVDLLPQHPGEGGEYLRGLLILLLYVIYNNLSG